MRVLVTGGSGFLGINMIRYLLRKGISVISLDIVEFEYPEKNLIETIIGDIRNIPLMEQTIKRVDIIIHAAAALPLYSKKDIFSINVNGTENVINTAYQYKIRRIIHISSTAVYGIPDHHPLMEEDELKGVGSYGESKLLAEKICETYRQKDLTISIIRPKSFIGPERLGVFSIFYNWAKEGKHFPMIGNGTNRYQFLDVEDLCEAIYLCMTLNTRDVNDTFNIGAKIFTTIKEDYQAVLNVAGFNKRIISFPAKPVILILRLLELLNLSPIYKWIYETADKDSFVSIDKAERVLGWSPKYSNKDALIRNYHWYLSNEISFETKRGVTHRVPWKQGLFRFFKLFF